MEYKKIVVVVNENIQIDFPVTKNNLRVIDSNQGRLVVEEMVKKEPWEIIDGIPKQVYEGIGWSPIAVFKEWLYYEKK